MQSIAIHNQFKQTYVYIHTLLLHFIEPIVPFYVIDRLFSCKNPIDPSIIA